MTALQSLAVLLAVGVTLLVGSAAAESPQEIFARRIQPILNSPNPSSCVQCHLSGVELKNYIRPTAEQTFASLRDQGLLDLDKPDESRILKLIKMGDDDRSESAKLSQQARSAELAAFAAWVKSATADARFRALPKTTEAERAGPSAPVEVIRHARVDRVMDSFDRNVWALRFRCLGCHGEGEPNTAKLSAAFGERVVLFRKAGREATFRHLTSREKLLDAAEPEKSLLLLKPLNAVKHEGGQKFSVGDEGHRAFRTWIEDYLRTRAGGYKTAEDLPKLSPTDTVERFGSELWLKLTDRPAEWSGLPLQARVFAWDAAVGRWETDPIAVAERPVPDKPGHPWHQTLILLAARDGQRAKSWRQSGPSLPEGRYLIRLRLDRVGRLAADWRVGFHADDDIGQIEYTGGWRTGWTRQTAVSIRDLRSQP